MSVWGKGLQGIFDRGMGNAIGGVFKGVGGFVTGAGRGMAHRASNAYSKAGIGKFTSAIGHGVGSILSVPITGAAYAGAGMAKALSKTIPQDYEWAKKMGGGILKSMSEPITQEMIGKGYVGIAGRVINPKAAWGISIGAIALGTAKGMGDSDYNIGIKYATNGIMDTEGVGITPGSVGASFTPITSRKPNNGLRDLGTDGNLGLALHNQRNTGQIRR